MRHIVLLAGLLVIGAVRAEDAKGTKVDLDGMVSTTPSTWVKETPANRMRFAQFRLPKAKGDSEDAELVLFKGLGGSARDNIARWKKQFVAPRGKTLDSKETTVKIGGNDASQIVVAGTYMFNPAPFNPKSKTVERPGYKMIAIHFEGPKDVYHIKLTGPEKTINQYQKGFEEWIKGFKK